MICPHEKVAEGGHFFGMAGRGVSDFVFSAVPGVIHRLVDSAGRTLAAT
jgi:hypothetical protein